jgi:hypothetical protein
MATVAQIRAAILAKLQAVANIGKVHDYERFAAREADMQALYKDATDGRIRGWNFYRTATAERDLDLGEVRRLHEWRFSGFLSLDDADATGKSFDDLVEAIATAFRTDRTLGGLVIDVKDMDNETGPSGIQIESIEPVMFAGVLCHRAQLSLVTETTEPNL